MVSDTNCEARSCGFKFRRLLFDLEKKTSLKKYKYTQFKVKVSWQMCNHCENIRQMKNLVVVPSVTLTMKLQIMGSNAGFEPTT